ncbi:MAG: hypothetical protein WC319_01670, partial [Candidatus Paceibacterota bacterium]
MKNRIIKFILLIVFFSVLVLTQGKTMLSAFAVSVGQDDFNPTLKSVSIYPTIISLDSNFYLHVFLNDTSLLVKNVNIVLESPAGKTLSANLVYSANGWYSRIEMPSDVDEGSWKVISIDLSDNLGNKKNLNKNEISYSFTVKKSETFVVEAGSNKDVLCGEIVELKGSITGSYSDLTTYSWFCSGVQNVIATTLETKYIIPINATIGSVVTCTLTVKDGLNSKYDTVKFLVKEAETFTVEAGSNKDVLHEEKVELKGSISGLHKDSMTHIWSCGSLTLTTPTELEASFIVPSAASGNITCTLTVKDGLNSKYDTVKFLVKEAETFTVEAGSNKDVLHEEKVELKGSI